MSFAFPFLLFLSAYVTMRLVPNTTFHLTHAVPLTT